MVFCWHADDDPILNYGLAALRFLRRSRLVLIRNPIFCDFSVGGPDHLSPPSGSAHETSFFQYIELRCRKLTYFQMIVQNRLTVNCMYSVNGEKCGRIGMLQTHLSFSLFPIYISYQHIATPGIEVIKLISCSTLLSTHF